MGRQENTFIGLAAAAKLLARTKDEVTGLCDEGLIRRKSTGDRILVLKKDVEEVRETNLQDLARPRDLVKRVMLLDRQVRALTATVNLMGKVNGLLSYSLDDLEDHELLAISEAAKTALSKKSWQLKEVLQFSEIFLRISEEDIIRLNEFEGVHDTWRAFYELCLQMNLSIRDRQGGEGRDVDTAKTLLHKGLTNLRSIGVLFIENEEFLNTSKELLRRTMSHDRAEFDVLIKQMKAQQRRKVPSAVMKTK